VSSKEQIRLHLFCTFSFTVTKKFTSIMRQPTRSTSERQAVFRKLQGSARWTHWWRCADDSTEDENTYI